MQISTYWCGSLVMSHNSVWFCLFPVTCVGEGLWRREEKQRKKAYFLWFSGLQQIGCCGVVDHIGRSCSVPSINVWENCVLCSYSVSFIFQNLPWSGNRMFHLFKNKTKKITTWIRVRSTVLPAYGQILGWLQEILTKGQWAYAFEVQAKWRGWILQKPWSQCRAKG